MQELVGVGKRAGTFPKPKVAQYSHLIKDSVRSRLLSSPRMYKTTERKGDRISSTQKKLYASGTYPSYDQKVKKINNLYLWIYYLELDFYSRRF